MPHKIRLSLPNQRDDLSRHVVGRGDRGRCVPVRCVSALGVPVRWVLLALAILMTCANSRADEFLTASRFYQQLAAPMTLVIDGKPFRDTMEQVAKEADLNIWIERRVDPTQIVNPGQLGPTVFAALQKVARQQECVVMPAANVVLVGRTKWVDATAAVLIATANTLPGKNFQWEMLSTPRQALATVMGTPVNQTLALPHDLWPAVVFQNVPKPVAVNLILSQFGRRTASANRIDLKRTVPLSDAKALPRRYTQSDALTSAIKALSPQPPVKVTGSIAVVTATARQHRELTAVVLSSAGAAAPNRSIDERQIESLKVDDARAGDILMQLAGVAAMKCTISREARAASEKIISVDIRQKTLRQVIEIVAEAADLQIQWAEKQFTVVAKQTDAPPGD